MTKRNSIGIYECENGFTVKQLKAIVKDWPEKDLNGEPTEVWIENGDFRSSPCFSIWPLNKREMTGDIILK